MKPSSEVLDSKTTSSPGPGVSLIDGKKQCPDCGKFVSKAYLKLHRDAIHLKKRVLCHDCGMTFTQAGSLKYHQMKTCKGKAKEVKELVHCEKCGKEMKKRNLAEHIKRVHIDKRVKCKLCGKELRKRSLAEHTERVHINEQVKCEQCGKEMKNKKTLKKHIRVVHINKSNFVKCDLCQKSLKKNSMKHHKAMHRRVFIKALRV